MAFNRLALEFPRLAVELERLSGDDLAAAVGRIVENGVDHNRCTGHRQEPGRREHTGLVA